MMAGMLSAVVKISLALIEKQIASIVMRTMRSSRDYQQSKQVAEWNSTNDREEISEKPEEYVTKPLGYQDSREANFLWELNYVLLQATLVVTITYSAALSPTWPDNDNINDGGHLARDRVQYRLRYAVCFFLNATAFIAGVVTILLLLVYSLSRRRWWLRALQAAMILILIGFMGAYVAGSCRDVAMSSYALALLGMMVFYYVCADVLCFPLWALRGRHGGSNSPTAAAPEAVEHTRRNLLIFATLVAAVTYQAGLNTPSGFLSSHSPDQNHLAGDQHLLLFFYLNTTAFVASLVMTMLLMNRTVTRHGFGFYALWVCTAAAVVGLTGAFAIGTSRSVKTSVYVVASVAAVMVYMSLQNLVLVRKPVEDWLGNEQRTLRRFLKLEQFPLEGDADEQAQGLSEKQGNLDADQLVKKSRTYLLLLGILAASVTYQAGLNPPGGIWQSNATDGQQNYINYPRRYLVSFYCSAMAFVASLVFLIIAHGGTNTQRIKSYALQVSMILDLFGLIGACAAGTSRQVSKSMYTSVIVITALLYVGIHVLLFMLQVFPNHCTWRPMVKRKIEESMPEWLKKQFEPQTKDEDEEMKGELEKSRKLLLLVGILSAVITYQAGMSPTDGFWQQNKTGHFVGNQVLQTGHDALIASIFIVSSLRWWLWTLGMFCIIGAFAAARSYCTLAISGLFARDGGNKFHKLLDTAESEDHRDPALCDPRETVDAKYLLLLAILAASITYQAGAKPPGASWQANATDGHHYGAGDSLLDTTYHRYLVVLYWNATAFMACQVILILLLSNISRTRGIKNCAFQVAMILELLELIGAFAAASCSKSKKLANRLVKRSNPREATWRVASAAPHHMTGNQSLLLACVHSGEGVVVHPATNEEMPLRVQGSGSVRTESIALDDVWYVPGLDSNLVSSGQLARQGCAISLGRAGCRITKAGALVGTARFTEACQFELDFLKVA